MFAELPKGAEVGNIAITGDGRIFCSIHKFYGSPTRAIEVLSGDRWQVYPNEDWGTEPNIEGFPWRSLPLTLRV